MPGSRRQALAGIAQRYDVRILEDDPYWLLADAPPPPIATLAPNHVLYVSTLSKCLAPGLRVAFVVLPDPDQRARSQYMRDWRSPGTEQLLLDGGLERVFGGIPAVEVDRYLQVLRQPGAMTAALAYYRAQSAADLEGLGPVTSPTLHVWSDGDHALGAAGAHATGGHVAGPYRFEVLSGVSHWVPEEAPDRLTALLLEHLR